MKPPKKIIHDYQNSIYIIVCEKKVYIVDDLTFNLKREIPGAYEQAVVSFDGRIVLLNDQNQMTMIDADDKAFLFAFNSGEVPFVSPVQHRRRQILKPRPLPHLQARQPLRRRGLDG